MDYAFVLREAGIRGPAGPILEGITASIRSGAVTVLLGPGGTGKSLLLRALSGRELPEGFSREGAWLRSSQLDGRSMWWGPQRRRDGNEPVTADWSKDLVLIDEPAIPDAQSRQELVERIRERKKGGAVVAVTHDVSFAQEIADDVYLLCAGIVAARGAAPQFFESPPGPLAAHFVAQGNGWPKNKEDLCSLPSHFRWFVPGRLAGMGVPGLLDDVDTDLRALEQAGIRTLVSLTEQPFSHPSLSERHLFVRHFAIRDMDVPPVARTASLCRDLMRMVDQGQRVAVHCRAGLGRTGTIIGAYHAWRGETPKRAIERVREICPRCIQNRAQEQFIRRFSDAVGPAPTRAPT